MQYKLTKNAVIFVYVYDNQHQLLPVPGSMTGVDPSCSHTIGCHAFL